MMMYIDLVQINDSFFFTHIYLSLVFNNLAYFRNMRDLNRFHSNKSQSLYKYYSIASNEL